MIPPDGRHLSFPFRIGADGRTAQVDSLEQHVRDELIQLVLTNPGERLYLPEFGAGVRRLVFENAGEITAAAAKASLSAALSRWLGQRVTPEELIVESSNATITIDLRYRVAGTPDQRRLRFERQGG
ncbi:GPW/gp25 family protein [Nodosilinea nodulosa]|uniref:GPW/gp25 family protein n=1 Tax=Nodosilinea nodulosa TaxID=416001 RepID=UPI0002EDCB3D|nr:GPW/gp25 family protein [Nodosilinea nodulosa]